MLRQRGRCPGQCPRPQPCQAGCAKRKVWAGPEKAAATSHTPAHPFPPRRRRAALWDLLGCAGHPVTQGQRPPSPPGSRSGSPGRKRLSSEGPSALVLQRHPLAGPSPRPRKRPALPSPVARPSLIICTRTRPQVGFHLTHLLRCPGAPAGATGPRGPSAGPSWPVTRLWTRGEPSLSLALRPVKPRPVLCGAAVPGVWHAPVSAHSPADWHLRIFYLLVGFPGNSPSETEPSPGGGPRGRGLVWTFPWQPGVLGSAPCSGREECPRWWGVGGRTVQGAFGRDLGRCQSQERKGPGA